MSLVEWILCFIFMADLIPRICQGNIPFVLRCLLCSFFITVLVAQVLAVVFCLCFQFLDFIKDFLPLVTLLALLNAFFSWFPLTLSVIIHRPSLFVVGFLVLFFHSISCLFFYALFWTNSIIYRISLRYVCCLFDFFPQDFTDFFKYMFIHVLSISWSNCISSKTVHRRKHLAVVPMAPSLWFLLFLWALANFKCALRTAHIQPALPVPCPSVPVTDF